MSFVVWCWQQVHDGLAVFFVPSVCGIFWPCRARSPRLSLGAGAQQCARLEEDASLKGELGKEWPSATTRTLRELCLQKIEWTLADAAIRRHPDQRKKSRTDEHDEFFFPHALLFFFFFKNTIIGLPLIGPRTSFCWVFRLFHRKITG